MVFCVISKALNLMVYLKALIPGVLLNTISPIVDLNTIWIMSLHVIGIPGYHGSFEGIRILM